MNRFQRVALASGGVAGCVLTILGLTALGSEARGPLAGTLAIAGSVVSGTESRVAAVFRGPGRAGDLAWFAPYRADAERLKRPEDLLLGAYDSGIPRTLQGVLELEDSLGATLPLVQLYSAWGDRDDQRFPVRLVDAIWDLGSIPVITWEPWLTDFENTLHPHLPLRAERDRGGMAAVARGEYDFYIDRWARDAARWGRPLMLRFAHEMNDPYRYPWGPQNNRPEDFVAAWKHVVERFEAAGASNVVWVWSPHVAYEGYEAFYPGEAHVDWIATGALNYGTVAYWSRWWSFDEIFGTRYAALAAYGKPIMIAEFGSLQAGGDRAVWLADAMRSLPVRYPAVRSLLFFHASGDATVTYQKLDWSFAGDGEVIGAIRAAMETWPVPFR